MASQEGTDISAGRKEACLALIARARVALDAKGTGEAALEKIKALLVALADQGEALFQASDFAMPIAKGRNHILACRSRPVLDTEVAWLGRGRR